MTLDELLTRLGRYRIEFPPRPANSPYMRDEVATICTDSGRLVGEIVAFISGYEEVEGSLGSRPVIRFRVKPNPQGTWAEIETLRSTVGDAFGAAP